MSSTNPGSTSNTRKTAQAIKDAHESWNIDIITSFELVVVFTSSFPEFLHLSVISSLTYLL
jgi:hypothetical protein